MSDWNVIKNFLLTSHYIKKFSEGFRSYPSINKNFWKFPKIIVGRSLQELSDIFWRLPTISEDFDTKLKSAGRIIFSTLWQISKIFQRFLKTSEDFRWFHKNFKKFYAEMFDIFRFFPEDFRRVQRFTKTSEDFWKFQKFVRMFVFALSGFS